MADKDNKMEKSIKEAIGKSLNEFNKRIGMAKLIKDNKNQDRILKGILSQVNDENTEKTEKSNVITLDNSTDGIVELKEIKGDTNVNVSKMEKETPITHVIDDKYGNVISLDGITEGAINIDDIEGNTMVNCCKDGSKELILNGDINTSGYNNVTFTEGVDGGKVDIALEGNTMVNVCDQEDPIAITKNYEVTTGNHIALQGEYDGKCRPNAYGNTMVNLWNKDKLELTGQCSLKGNKITCTTTDNIYSNFFIKDMSMFKPSTDYTFIINITKNTLDTTDKIYIVSYGNGNNRDVFSQAGTANYIIDGGVTGLQINKLTTYSSFEGAKIGIRSYIYNKSKTVGRQVELDVIVLEGDYTNKPIPDYFTGMKSSFEDKLVPENLINYNEVVCNYNEAKNYQSINTKANQIYTVVVNILENTCDKGVWFSAYEFIGQSAVNDYYLGDVKQGNIQLASQGKTGIFKLRIGYTQLDSKGTRFVLFAENSTSGSFKATAYVVEGDYTNYDFTDYDSTKGGKYKVDYKVTGKNKCPRCVTTSVSNNGITFTYDATTQIFSYSGTATNTSVFLSVGCPDLKLLKDKSYIFSVDNPLTDFSLQVTELGVGFNSNIPPNTIATPIINLDKFTPNAIMLYSQNLTVGQSYSGTFKVQVEEGTKATTYEPYKESIKTLYLNSPLLEGDTIEQSGNDIVHNHRYKSVTFDGSEDEINRSSITNTDCVRYYIKAKDIKPTNTDNTNFINMYSDKFITNMSSEALHVKNIEGISSTWDKYITVSILKSKLSSQDVIGFKQYLQQNPITVVYELATPTREVISTNDNLLLDSYVNGHLDMDTIIPIDKVVFKTLNLLLKYVCENTDYTIQFESDNIGKLNSLYMNGALLSNIDVVKGLNKITCTTLDKGYKTLDIDGIGFNASKIVVTPKVDEDFGYFKGMKSVGEDDVNGNKIEILSQNKNLWNPIIDNNTNNFKCEATYSNGILTVKGTGDGTTECYTRYNNGNYFISQHLKPNTSYYFSYESDGEFGQNGTDTIETFIFGSFGQGIKYNIPPKGATFKTDNKGFIIFRFDVNKNDMTHTFYNFMLTEGTTSIPYTTHKSNKKEILLNEPLRGLPNGVKDKYVMIDGKLMIQRNCAQTLFDGNTYVSIHNNSSETYIRYRVGLPTNAKNSKSPSVIINSEYLADNIVVLNLKPPSADSPSNSSGLYSGSAFYDSVPVCYISIEKSKLITPDVAGFKDWLNKNKIKVIYELAQPTYEPIDYNPFEIYTDVTHISNNSIIPCNMIIRNSGYNCILKPSTLYTVVLDTNKMGTIGMNLGGVKGTTTNNVLKLTTPATLTDNTLRLYGKDIKGSNIRLLEGDKTNWIPSHFEGMKSCFEDNLQDDGKYKMEILSNNKNLLNLPYTNGNRLSSSKLLKAEFSKPVVIGKTYTFSFNSNIIGAEGSKLTYCLSYEDEYYNGNTIYIALIGGGREKITFTATSDKIYFIGGVTDVCEYWDFQLEENTEATDYISYKSNKIQFLLNEPLRAVGDIKDKVYVKEDKVVVERNCKSITLDGSEDEHWAWVSKNGYAVIEKKYFPNPQIPNSKLSCNTLPYMDNFDINIKCIKTGNNYSIMLNGFNDLNSAKQWLQANPTTIVYQLAEPVYEEIEYSNNRLILDSYDNSTLFYDSNIPISNTSFKPLWEELVYVKNSTTYYIQFNAIGSGDVVVNLGGTELSTTITEGYNKIEITTPNKSTNLLTIDGQGIKISKVVVSESLCSGYYKGLQSCFEEHMENGKYVCVIRGISLDGSKVNGIKFYLNEPLRGIGDIKDKLCIKDNKLMVERNCGSVTFDGKDEQWASTGYGGHATRNTFEISLSINACGSIVPAIGNLFTCEQTEKIPINNDAFRVYTNAQNYSYFLFTPSTTIIPYRDTNKWKQWLQQNPVTIVYQLATPVYEEVTNEYGLPIILEGYENGIVYVDSAVTPTTSIKYTSNNTVPATLSNVDNLNTTTQDDINNNIVTYMMDIDMMLTEMEMEDNASVMSLSDSNDDNNQKHNRSHNNILDRMNKEDRIKYQDNTTKMLEKVIKGKSLTKEENINRIDLYLNEGKIREEQSNYLKELLKGGE